jgi:hypothetical protein
MTLSTDFNMKIGEVNHHLLDDKGNANYEDYGKVVEGWPYVNVDESDYSKWVRVKFIAPSNAKLKYYVWDFGDGTTLKTINREVEHKYNLTTYTTWMTNSGIIPIQQFNGQYSGYWTNVSLTAVSYDNRVETSVNTVVACVYKIISVNPTEITEIDGDVELDGDLEIGDVDNPIYNMLVYKDGTNELVYRQSDGGLIYI